MTGMTGYWARTGRQALALADALLGSDKGIGDYLVARVG